MDFLSNHDKIYNNSLFFLLWSYKARIIHNKAQITITIIDLVIGNYVTFLPQYPIWEDIDVSASRRLVPPDRVKAKYFWKSDVVAVVLEPSAVSLLSSILQGSMLVNASLDMQILEITFWNTVNNSDINPNSINSAKKILHFKVTIWTIAQEFLNGNTLENIVST